jgi:hypothetical protein
MTDPVARTSPTVFQLASAGVSGSSKLLKGSLVNLIIVGLHSSPRFGVISHLIATTAYDVVRHAGSPILTVNCASEKGLIGAKAAQITTKAFSDTDLIRIRGFGVR